MIVSQTAPGTENRLAFLILEILYLLLVFFSSVARIERAEISAFARLWILLNRIDPILPAFEFPDHFCLRKIGSNIYARRPIRGFRIAMVDLSKLTVEKGLPQ